MLNAFCDADNCAENTNAFSENTTETFCLSVEKCYHDISIGVEPYTTPETEPQILHIQTKREAAFDFGKPSWSAKATG